MPKPITVEMLEAMSLDTDQARGVIELLSQGDLLGPAKPAPSARAKPAKPRATSAKTKAAPKPVSAVYGRQA